MTMSSAILCQEVCIKAGMCGPKQQTPNTQGS